MIKMANDIVDVNGKYSVELWERTTDGTPLEFIDVRNIKVAENGILVLRGSDWISTFADGKWGRMDAKKTP